MKALEFIYQETEIHFLVNGSDKNVMINATEMAKAFGKKTEVFLKTDHAKAFISALINPPNGGVIAPVKEEEVLSFRSRNGMYFHRALALKFAAWLDPYFEVWVYTKIEEVVFGNYKKHYDAHYEQEKAILRMESAKKQMLLNPTPELVNEYFIAENDMKNAKSEKMKALRRQYSLFSKQTESED